MEPTQTENSSTMFERKDSIEGYISNNKFNKDLYYAILSIPNDEFDLASESYPIKLDELFVFNRAYEICNDLKKAESPLSSLEMLYNNVLDGSTSYGKFKKYQNVIFCCVYVILSESKSSNQHIELCLPKIKSLVDKDIFQHFEPLLNRNSITQLTPNTFEQIKKQANEIADLNERIIFLDGVLAVAKLSKADASTVNDIEGEIEQIRQKIGATIRTMGVTTETVYILLKKLEVPQYADNTKIAAFIHYLTGFCLETIRQRLSSKKHFTTYHKQEVDYVNDLLSNLNIKERITYDKN